MTEAKHKSSVEITESDCEDVIDKNGRETVVRLSLYAVLGFLVLIFSVVIGFIFTANASRDNAQRELRDRVIVLEGKFDVISGGITDLKSAMKDVAGAMRELETRGRR